MSVWNLTSMYSPAPYITVLVHYRYIGMTTKQRDSNEYVRGPRTPSTTLPSDVGGRRKSNRMEVWEGPCGRESQNTRKVEKK